MNPITEIEMIDSRTSEIYINLILKIKENGDLYFDGCDSGKRIKEIWDDFDYEYFTTIDKKYKDTILLLLIKEFFEDDFEFRDFLKKKEIPFKFENWV